MYNLEKAKQSGFYRFNWEVQNVDCRPYKIRSPTFKVHFEVTKWQMELDLSKLKNIDSCVPFRLERKPGIGPCTVTFDVEISARLGSKYPYLRRCHFGTKRFAEGGFMEILIPIPSQSQESDCLSSKSLFICVDIRRERPFWAPKKYWYSERSLTAVEENLKTLFSVGNFHDLELKVDGKLFKLHKCILNARWPKLMSSLNISETSVEVETEAIRSRHHTILEKLFQFAYCGDLKFMQHINGIEGGYNVLYLIKEYNLYRLNDSINLLSSHCNCTQTIQSYKTSVKMSLANVKSTEKSIGVFKTCSVPQQMDIGFMDLVIFVNKDEDAFGYNWLKFSVILNKLPQGNPVTIICKLYAIGEHNIKALLTEECLIFDKENKHFEELSSSTPFSRRKESKRYQVTSRPIITWEELIDERNNFVQKRTVGNPQSRKSIEEKDIFFEFQLKLANGKYTVDQKHGECCKPWYEWDHKIFEDLKLMFKDKKFTDIEVTSCDGKRCFKAHKALLATRSKTLNAILEKQPELEVLKLDIEPDYLQFFIRYLYTGQIQEVPSDKIDHLLSVACKYDMNCLKEVLENQNLKRKMPLEEESSCNKKLAT